MSTAHQGDYCQHKDKMCMSRGEASTVVKSLGRSKGQKVEAYHCTFCDHWHVAKSRSASVRGVARARSHNKSKRR